MREMKLQDLKSKTPAELVSFAEELGVENASTMRKQELMFAILKQLAIQETDIFLTRLFSLPGLRMEAPPRVTFKPDISGYELRGFRVAVELSRDP